MEELKSHKKRRETTSGKHDECIEPENHDNRSISGQCLTYDVLRIIFKYLSGLDLSKAATVCRYWKEVANSEERSRSGPVCLTKKYVELDSIATCDDKVNESVEHLKKQIIRELTIKPKIGIFFTWSFPIVACVQVNEEGVPRSSNQSKEVDSLGCHCKMLPPNCDSITVEVYGIIINNTEIEENNETILCAFLPQIPGVTISAFILEKYPQDMKGALDESCNYDRSMMKCLIVLCDFLGHIRGMELLSYLKTWSRGNNISIWGGIATELMICNSSQDQKNTCRKSTSCVCIALSGPGIQTWSMFLESNCTTKQQVENRIKSFREKVQLKKHSVGFMFACCARGSKLYNEDHVESTLFKKYFPQVPLVGCFGDGEFGRNTVSIDSSKKLRKSFWAQMSTSILVITYG